MLSVGIPVFSAGGLSGLVLAFEDRAMPLKFDYYLYLIDRGLCGSTVFGFSRALAGPPSYAMAAIYESLFLVMVVWYWLGLRQGNGSILRAYLISFTAGPLLYLLLPACGPRFAFASVFPSVDPVVSAALVPLQAPPNAIPSLHLSTAILFTFFAAKSRILRVFSWMYLAGTAMATVAVGQHYLIDLIVAVPFACFVAAIVHRRVPQGLGNLALVLAWLVSIRFATPLLTGHLVMLRLCAAATVCVAPYILIAKLRVHAPETPDRLAILGFPPETKVEM